MGILVGMFIGAFIGALFVFILMRGRIPYDR